MLFLLTVIMLNAVIQCHSQCCYDDCHYAESCFANCHYAECCNNEFHYDEYRILSRFYKQHCTSTIAVYDDKYDGKLDQTLSKLSHFTHFFHRLELP